MNQSGTKSSGAKSSGAKSVESKVQTSAQKKSEGSGLRSMTGFGSATAQLNGLSLTAMLRSVNHRHMDLRVHLPEWLLPLEHKARTLIQSRNARGHIDLRVTAESTGGTGVSIDESLVARYMETLGRLNASYNLGSPDNHTSAAALLQLPGVVTRKDVSDGIELSAEWEALFLHTLERAVDGWDQMRAQEGAALAADMRERLQTLKQLADDLQRDKPEVLRMTQARLLDRVKALTEQTGLDPARLAQEASLLADRTDVSEEMVRLTAHIEHFAEILNSAADAGRKLDFLLQEMNREANTLLSKISGLGEASLEMTRQGMDAKAEIEKLREQIQNLQ